MYCRSLWMVLILICCVDAQSANQDILISARKTELRWFNPDDPSDQGTLIPARDIRNAVAVSYDPVDQYVYWTDVALHVISRSKLDGSDQSIVVRDNLVTPDGLLVDVDNRKLFWTDTGAGRDVIESSSLDGAGRRVIISGLDEPRAIVLDNTQNVMFWTDWGDHAKIEKASKDGSQRTVLVDTDLVWPNALVLDIPNNKMYWADAGTDVIEVANMDGSGREIFLNVNHVFGLAILGEFLYWSDWEARNIEKIKYVTKTERTTVASYMISLGALSIARKPSGQNWMYIAGSREIRRIDLNKPKDLGQILPLTRIFDVLALEYDPVDDHVFWIDQSTGHIFKAFGNATGGQQQILEGTGGSAGIAVWSEARKVIWTDHKLNMIQIADVDGTDRRVILSSNITTPYSVTVNPSTSTIYWTSGGATPRIERVHHTGSSRELLVDSDLILPYAITLDTTASQIFWTDRQTGKIETASLDGSNRLTLIEGSVGLGLTLTDQYLYWVSSKTIKRTDRTTSLTVDVMSNENTNTFMGLSAGRAVSQPTNVPTTTTPTPTTPTTATPTPTTTTPTPTTTTPTPTTPTTTTPTPTTPTTTTPTPTTPTTTTPTPTTPTTTRPTPTTTTPTPTTPTLTTPITTPPTNTNVEPVPDDEMSVTDPAPGIGQESTTSPTIGDNASTAPEEADPAVENPGGLDLTVIIAVGVAVGGAVIIGVAVAIALAKRRQSKRNSTSAGPNALVSLSNPAFMDDQAGANEAVDKATAFNATDKDKGNDYTTRYSSGHYEEIPVSRDSTYLIPTELYLTTGAALAGQGGYDSFTPGGEPPAYDTLTHETQGRV